MARSQPEATLTIEPAPDFGPNVRRVVVDCPHATTRVHIGDGAFKMDDDMASALAVQTHFAEEGCACTRALRLQYLSRRIA